MVDLVVMTRKSEPLLTTGGLRAQVSTRALVSERRPVMADVRTSG